MGNKPSTIQMQLVARNQRNNGPTSSNDINDMTLEVSHDLQALISQWNINLVPATNTLPTDTGIDAFTDGIDGNSIYTKHDATSSSHADYYDNIKSRPHTIFEQFGDVYSDIATLESNLDYHLNNISIDADQVPIDDNATLYTSTNVETALAEVMTKVNVVAANSETVDFEDVDSNIIPHTDDTYDLGSPSKRWKDLYLGPTSLHIDEYTVAIDSASLAIKHNTNSIFTVNEDKASISSTNTDAGAYTILDLYRTGSNGNDDTIDVGLYLNNSDNTKCEFGRISAIATDTTNNNEAGKIVFQTPWGGTLTERMSISSNGLQIDNIITLGSRNASGSGGVWIDLDDSTGEHTIAKYDTDTFYYGDDILAIAPSQNVVAVQASFEVAESTIFWDSIDCDGLATFDGGIYCSESATFGDSIDCDGDLTVGGTICYGEAPSGAAYSGDLNIDPSTGDIGIPSSIRITKQNIVDMEDTSWLYTVRPVNFEYKDSPIKKKSWGIIAEELFPIRPEFIAYKVLRKEVDKDYVPTSEEYVTEKLQSDGTTKYTKINPTYEMRGINYSHFIPVLVNEIQKLNDRIKVLETKLEDK